MCIRPQILFVKSKSMDIVSDISDSRLPKSGHARLAGTARLASTRDTNRVLK